MPSLLITLLASLPLVLLPPGVCPCHVFGLECDGAAGSEQDEHQGDDHDCGCPKVKVLAAPETPQDGQAGPAVVLDTLLEVPPRITVCGHDLEPVPLAPPLVDPPLYLAL